MHKFNIKSLPVEQKQTRLRILELSYHSNFSHIGSCLSAVDLIDAVYKTKKAQEKFILSNGHAGIALYAILEKNGLIKNKQITANLNIHPDRNLDLGIHVSSGSLGQGLPIALGMAFADKKENVYCMISDGECTEGSIWETLRLVSEKKVNNLKIILNSNGWGAYDPVNTNLLIRRLRGFGMEIIRVNGHNVKMICKALRTPTTKRSILIHAQTSVEQFPFLKGQDAHYRVMTKKDYSYSAKLLK